MAENFILVYTNQSLVATSHLNKVYYFFPWGQLGASPYREQAEAHLVQI